MGIHVDLSTLSECRSCGGTGKERSTGRDCYGCGGNGESPTEFGEALLSLLDYAVRTRRLKLTAEKEGGNDEP